MGRDTPSVHSATSETVNSRQVDPRSTYIILWTQTKKKKISLTSYNIRHGQYFLLSKNTNPIFNYPIHLLLDITSLWQGVMFYGQKKKKLFRTPFFLCFYISVLTYPNCLGRIYKDIPGVLNVFYVNRKLWNRLSVVVLSVKPTTQIFSHIISLCFFPFQSVSVGCDMRSDEILIQALYLFKDKENWRKVF